MKTAIPLALFFVAVITFGFFTASPLHGAPYGSWFTYDIIIGLHLLAVGATLLLVFYADSRAMRWIRTPGIRMNRRTVAFLHHGVSTGLAVIITTGALLLIPLADFIFKNPVFIVKMGAVGALIINSIFLDILSKKAITRSFDSLSPRERMHFLLAGGVSVLGWLTALGGGLLLHH